MNFFDHIENRIDSLNKNETYLLNYFIDNSQKIKDMKIKDASKEVFVSPATIVRFCQKLGFSGFIEFKNSLWLTIEQQNQDTDLMETPMVESNIFDDVIKTKNLVSETTIDEIIQLIHASERMDFYGEGSSRIVCEEMTRRFRLVKKQSYFYDDTSLMYLSASNLKPGDIAFCVSMSGETSQILKAANIAKTTGATLISVTNMSNNSLSNIADKALFVISTKYRLEDMNFVSRIPALVILEYIFNRYVERYY